MLQGLRLILPTVFTFLMPTPSVQQTRHALQVRPFDLDHDVLLFEFRTFFEQGADRLPAARTQDWPGQTKSHSMKLRLQIERVGEVQIAEEGHDLLALREQRLHQPLQFRAELIRIFQAGHTPLQ